MRSILILAALTIASETNAAPLSYGGRLVEENGRPVAGPVDLSFQFYRLATGGSPVLGAAVEKTGVTLENGLFQATIDLSAADFATVFPNAETLTFIQVTDLTHTRTYPRQQFFAVPFAARVPVDSETLHFDAAGKLAVKTSNLGAVTLASESALGLGEFTSTPACDGSTKGQLWFQSGFVSYCDGTTVKSLSSTGAGGILANSIDTLTNKTIDADLNSIADLSNANIKAAAGIEASKIGTGNVEDAELAHLNGVTSAIQTQLNDKRAASDNIDLATADVTGILPLANGGTGMTTLTDHGILLGKGSSPIGATAVLSNGQLLIGSSGADPVPASLTQGANQGVTISGGAGTLALDTAQDIRSSAVPTFGGMNLTGALALPANGLTVGSGQIATSGGNVGIGTTSPSAKLDIRGDAASFTTPQLVIRGATENEFFRAGFDTTGGYGFVDAYNGVGVQPFALNPSGGNVGIDNVNPQQKLHVGSGGLVAMAAFTTSSTGATDTDGFVAGYDGFTIGGAKLWNFENSPLVVGTNNAERMRIDSSGNVGIGTTIPVAALTVKAAAVAATSESVARFDVSDNATAVLRIGNASSTNGNFIPRIDATGDSTFQALMVRGGITTDTGTIPAINFDARLQAGGDVATRPLFDFSNNGTSNMRVLANGNVGIGTTDPTAKLHIGGVAGTDGIRFPDGTLQTSAANPTATAATAGLSGANFNLSQANGVYENVGLSTTLPSAGTYLLTADVCGSCSATGSPCSLTSKLYNSTDAADVANSYRTVAYGWSSEYGRSTAPVSIVVTVNGSKVIQLHGSRITGGTWVESYICGGGMSTLTYVKLAN